jgi:hypothetical protein
LTYARLLGSAAALIVTAAAVTACGGGGGGGGTTTPVPGPTPTPVVTASPSPTPNPSLVAQFSSALDNGSVQFSCGCTAQAGTQNLSSTAGLTIPQSSPALPNTPQPTYTIKPGRNYVIIAKAPTTNRQEWTMIFAGNDVTRNQYLGQGATGSTPVDTAATLAALYVFEFSPNPNAFPSGETFDDWNFNAVSAWVTHLRTAGAPTATEQQALNDVVAQQGVPALLFPDPGQPMWQSQSGAGNATMKNDLNAIKNDATATSVPTPCPSGTCTGGPTP